MRSGDDPDLDSTDSQELRNLSSVFTRSDLATWRWPYFDDRCSILSELSPLSSYAILTVGLGDGLCKITKQLLAICDAKIPGIAINNTNN